MLRWIINPHNIHHYCTRPLLFMLSIVVWIGSFEIAKLMNATLCVKPKDADVQFTRNIKLSRIDPNDPGSVVLAGLFTEVAH